MDNKKWYKRLNTVFWWLLSALPILAILLSFFSTINLFGNDVVLQDAINSEGGYNSIYPMANIEELLDDNVIYNFISTGTLPFLKNCFADLFQTFGFNIYYSYNIFLQVSLAWFVSVHIYHLIVDVLVWLPNMLHKLIDKYQD